MYPDEFSAPALADMTGVSRRTARRWQAHSQQMHPAASRLIALHHTGRILPDNWHHTRFDYDILVVNGERYGYADMSSAWVTRNRLSAAMQEVERLRARVLFLEQFEPARAPVIAIR